MNGKQIAWGIVTIVLVLISLFFGVRYPLPEQPTALPALAGAGVNVRTEKALQVMNDASVGGNLTVGGAITGGSFSPDEFSTASDLIADTGQFTTSLKVGATPVALLSGSAIDATSLKVAATPVALQVGALAAGARMVCGSTQVTGTTTLPTGLATPQYVNLSLAQDVTADCAKLSYTNAAGVVTAKCWTSSATPAAATTPAAVNWCAIGK